MKIQFAERCAWRAIYITAFGKQAFRLGVDPNDGVKPVLFIASGLFGWRGYRGLRIPLPTVRWGWASQYGPQPRFRIVPSKARMWLYRMSRKFWSRVDGRYQYYRQRRERAGQ